MAYNYYLEVSTIEPADSNGRNHIIDMFCLEENAPQPSGAGFILAKTGQSGVDNQDLHAVFFSDAGLTFHECCMYVWNDTTNLIEEFAYTEDYYMGAIRAWRDHCIQKSDWTQLPDVKSNMTTQEQTDWENYRQALRDITSGIPDEATKEKLAKRDPTEWPTEP